MKFETFPVAGAAQPEKNLAEGNFRSHTCVTEDDGSCRTLCRVKVESLLDDGNWDGPGCTDRKPTCKTCAKRDPRFAK